MTSLRFLVASIALLAVPLASAAPAPADPVAAPEPVEQCGHVAYQVTVGPVQTSCIPVVESYFCPGGGGYIVVLGLVQVGECTPCCDPAPATVASAQPDPVEVRQCDHWGNSIVLFGKVESPCITTGCSPTCATASRPGLWHVEECAEGEGTRFYVLDQQVTECGPGPATLSMHCNKPHGVQVYVDGEPATRCVPLPHGV